MTTTHLLMPFIAASQAQKHITHNEALALLDALVHLSVIDNALSTPPGAPAEGDRYIVAAAATDDWTGWEGSVAAFIGGIWVELTPNTGWVVWVESASGRFVYSGGGWVASIEDASSDGKTYFRKDNAWVTGWPYDFRLEFAGTPIGSEVMGKIVFARETVIAADMAGSAGSVGVTPTATFNIDVRDDGVSIGTVSIATDGAFTFTTVGGTAKTILAGSEVTFIAPVADATILDIIITFIGVA